MVDGDPSSKIEEHYPLLKVEGGAGDGAGHQHTIVTSPGWTVSCTPKQSWFSRWPELFSACWMTAVLLGISLLVFYALGMGAYRRHSIILIKCNDTKPASNVYYHHIIPRGVYNPLFLYSEYIAHMASEYASLRFNVFFLTDDSLQTTFPYSRHTKLISRIIPTSLHNVAYNYRLDENTRGQFKIFEKKYGNVNITMMPLSKFMSMTPLKSYWRSVPFGYLTFYARVFSVWQNGGIGVDLITYNNYFRNNQPIDCRILSILKQHDNGINPNEYTNALKKMDGDKEFEMFGVFFNLINQIVNETRSLFNNSLSFAPPTTINNLNANTSVIKHRRDKRELPEMRKNIPVNVEINSSIPNEKGKITEETKSNNLGKNFYQFFSNGSPTSPSIKSDGEVNNKINNTNNSDIHYNTQLTGFTPESLSANKNLEKVIVNNSNIPHIVMFYDFSIFTDENNVGPSFMLPEILQPDLNGMLATRPEYVRSTKHNKKSQFLSLDPDGTFIAASSPQHPMLGHILSSGYQCFHPKLAIKDTLSNLCSSMFRDNQYCNNIFLL